MVYLGFELQILKTKNLKYRTSSLWFNSVLTIIEIHETKEIYLRLDTDTT